MEQNFSIMKNIFLLFQFLVIIISCKEQKKTIITQKPSFDSIGKMSYERAVIIYGKPFEHFIFNIEKMD
jgi:hypothetical protein